MAQLVECVPNFSEGPNKEGAALGSMVGHMTYVKRQFDNLDGVMRRLIPPFHQATDGLLDTDSSAFNSYTVHFCQTTAGSQDHAPHPSVSQ
ncbi:hypothetical protein Q5P01_000760 [Channa striata]|uniref:Cyclodeaminase/cyclohydrolase domain-containing protein n=1 Tax=Channa striata TaxID=64152 RepID=A0AA88IKD2_CHASR|nr:hypothetical protein Q5P01_000760 [Channa striata]